MNDDGSKEAMDDARREAMIDSGELRKCSLCGEYVAEDEIKLVGPEGDEEVVCDGCIEGQQTMDEQDRDYNRMIGESIRRA